MQPINILPRDLEIVRAVLSRFVPGIEVRAFGSRATGKARRFSDLDLVVMTEQPLDLIILTNLKTAFSDSSLPFKVDALDWASLDAGFRRLIIEDSLVLQDASASL